MSRLPEKRLRPETVREASQDNTLNRTTMLPGKIRTWGFPRKRCLLRRFNHKNNPLDTNHLDVCTGRQVRAFHLPG